MKKMQMFLLAAALAAVFTACKKDSDNHPCQNAVEATFRDLTGLDGCGFVLELANGSRLEISNLDELDVTPKDSMKVRVSYGVLPNLGSVCMTGPVVRVDCIEKVQE